MTVFPKVSCVCITSGRPTFLQMAIDRFKAQDYRGEKELIVVSDGVKPNIPSNVVGIHFDSIRSMGEKRQAGFDRSSGELISHWDDDDWSADNRISKQVASIIYGGADVSVIQNDYLLFLPDADWRRFRTRDQLGAGIFPDATLCFRRDLMYKYGPYGNCNPLENTRFIANLIDAKKKIVHLANEDSYVYVRHPGTAVSFRKDDQSLFEVTTRPAFFSEELERVFIGCAIADAP